MKHVLQPSAGVIFWSLIAFMGRHVPSAFVRAQPSNDVCSAATPAAVGQAIMGDVMDATPDGLAIPLGCNGNQDGSGYGKVPGVWYSFTAVRGYMSVALAERASSISPMQITIYRGTCGNTTLQCVTRFYAEEGYAPFIYKTEVGAKYYMLVQNQPRDKTKSNPFKLTTSGLPGVYGNDVCSGAEPIVIGTPVNGKILQATSDELEVVDDCEGEVVDYSMPGVWYTFQGTGQKLTAALPNAKTTLSIYTGACGRSTLKCVAGGASVSFYTNLGETYFVLHRRGVFYSDPIFPFSIVATVADLYPNDRCPQATPITLGKSFVGAFDEASFLVDPPSDCGERKPSLWYSFEGTGGRITAVSKCETGKYGNAVHVFSGVCSSLQCSASFRVQPCDAATSTFNTVAGTKYFLLMQPTSSYEFEMTLVPAPLSIDDNDMCSQATPIAMGSASLRNNISLATTDEKDVTLECSTCGNVTRLSYAGLWFRFQGTGGRVWLDVCGGVSTKLSLETRVSVYDGTCGPKTLRCVAGGDSSHCGFNAEKLMFNTSAGTQYYARVERERDFMPSEGNDLEKGPNLFDIVLLSVVSPPLNDVCSTAAPTAVGSTIVGDLAFASADESEVSTVCDSSGSAFYSYPGLWYRFQGIGGNVKVTSASCLEYGAADIHVYKGTCGPSTLLCVAGFSANIDCIFDDTPIESSFNFTTAAGSTYYMLVRTGQEEFDSQKFRVKLESIPIGPFDQYPVVPRIAEPAKQCIVSPSPQSPPKLPSTAAPKTPIVPNMPPKLAPTVAPKTPTAASKTPIAPNMLPVPVGDPVLNPTPGSPIAVAPPPRTADSPASDTAPMVIVPSPPSPVVAPLPMATTTIRPVVSAPKAPPIQIPTVSVPTPVGRCRLGCRIRRFFKKVFGVFT